MPRRISALVSLIGFSVLLLAMIWFSIGRAAPLVQEAPLPTENGQIYQVLRGDSLSRISGEFYNDSTAYPQIVEATNAMAAIDERFAIIQDPRRILVGQLLWLPDELPFAMQESSRSVRFAKPTAGATVAPTFTVVMAAESLTVEPAGEIVEGAGHFHILVDTDFVPPQELIPFDDGHLHFGGGQLTTTLALEPGVHTLRLQFANGAHQALEGPEYRDAITVTVDSSVDAMMDMADDAPSVRFAEPEPGATVAPTFTVAMAAQNLTVEPAGEIVEGAGHFHILVDTDFVPPQELIPFDDGHLHFGGGQLTTTLALEPGVHTLRLQFANGAHQALEGPEYRDAITVTVEPNVSAEIEVQGSLSNTVKNEPESDPSTESAYSATQSVKKMTIAVRRERRDRLQPPCPTRRPLHRTRSPYSL